jgi:hypothetical protein
MNMDHLMFVGFELTDEVKSLIDGCSDRDRIYLDDPSFLETVDIDNKRYVGKRVKDGIAIDRIEDTARSVVSLLTRVNSDWSKGADQAMVMAVEEGTGASNAVVEDEEGSDSERFDYLGLVD